jgi:hypothetical protein
MAGVLPPDVTAIPLGRPSPGASSNQPERQGQRMRPRSRPRAASASLLFGLAPGGACRAADVAARAVRSCRTLSPLPVRRTLRPAPWAVCFLWRFPWGRPRRTLSGAASVWSPDFPPLRSGDRPADWRNGHMGAEARRSRRKERAALGLNAERTPQGPLGEGAAGVYCSFTRSMGLMPPKQAAGLRALRPVAFLGGEQL